MSKKPEYITTDLELLSKQDLNPIIKAFEDKLSVTHKGKDPKGSNLNFVSFGIVCGKVCGLNGSNQTPENEINGFCDLIDSLPNDLFSLVPVTGERHLYSGIIFRF